MSDKAQQCIKRGDLQGALSELKNHIRDNPAHAESRIFLFQLQAVLGDWDRALTQLNVAADLDASAMLMAQTCRELINCEDFRSTVFSGERAPLVFGEPAAWLATLIQSAAHAAKGEIEAAARGANSAFEAATAASGSIDGEAFSWLADADMRLGPTTEVIVNGKYYWIPFSSISEITLQAPVDLRDLVWIPAEFKWKNQGESVGFIPARYPDQSDDDLHKLGRKTEWNDLGNDYFTGLGQRVLATDVGDYPILQVRHIVFNQPDNAEHGVA